MGVGWGGRPNRVADGQLHAADLADLVGPHGGRGGDGILVASMSTAVGYIPPTCDKRGPGWTVCVLRQGVWGFLSSAFPFVNDIRFSLAASLAILVVTACVFVVSWKRPKLVLKRAAYLCTAFLAGVNLVSGLGLLRVLPDAAGIALTAAAYGLGSAVPHAVWLALIAALPAGECLLVIAAAYLLSAFVSPVFTALPEAAGCLAACAACAASIASLARMPGAPTCGQDCGRRPDAASARSALVPVAGPVAVFLALEMVMGLVMSFQAAGDPGGGSGVGLKMAASICAYVCLIVLALRRRGLPDIRLLFEKLFPLIALALALLPFASKVYEALFSTVLVFLQGIVGTSVLFLLLQSSREQGIPTIACVAAVSFVTRVFVVVGLALGWSIGAVEGVDATARVLMVAGAALYSLSMVLVWSFKSRRAADGSSVKSHVGLGVDDAPGQTAANNMPVSFDEIATRLAQAHALTARERQVVVLVACGRSAVYVADELGIAPETVRSYLKSAYPKLGVHSKQELIDLFVDCQAPG